MRGGDGWTPLLAPQLNHCVVARGSCTSRPSSCAHLQRVSISAALSGGLIKVCEALWIYTRMKYPREAQDI